MRQQAHKNPYWNVYLNGKYEDHYLPEYLKKKHYSTLQKNVSRLTVETDSVINFLQKTNKTYTHFVLLDHMDWMAGVNKPQLEKEWMLILKRAEPGAKILFRTAHKNIDFIPPGIRKKVEFNQIDPEWIAINDRVGTYTGTYTGIVK